MSVLRFLPSVLSLVLVLMMRGAWGPGSRRAVRGHQGGWRTGFRGLLCHCSPWDRWTVFCGRNTTVWVVVREWISPSTASSVLQTVLKLCCCSHPLWFWPDLSFQGTPGVSSSARWSLAPGPRRLGPNSSAAAAVPPGCVRPRARERDLGKSDTNKSL